MGKHSDPKPSWGSSAVDLVRSVRPRRSSGRHSEATTATGVMRAVKRKPMVAAIALPAAAVAAVVGSATVLAPGGTDDSVVHSDTVAKSNPDVSTAAPVDTSKKDADAAKRRVDELKNDKKFSGKDGDVSLKTPAPKTSSSEASSPSSSASAKSAKSSSSAKKSSSKSAGGVSNAPCSVSSSVEKHFAANASKVYRAVCAKYPEVKTFGGYRNDPGSDHGTGHAVDIMITGSTGDSIRDYVIAHRKELGVKYVIWEQKIYAPYTGWNGRPMENRGGATANHFDHVHVSVN